MHQTRDLIYRLSHMACSVIIVGVGDADFASMEELDGDDGILTNSAGEPCPRDIVQFVEYQSAMHRGDLAEEVLKEVPWQFVSYMEMKQESAVPVKQVLEKAR